ncbi:glutathione S-transferase family protein [Acuticoccus mangrovi]|uniref:Glutathione S-transferase family protein n=1 Tax=Acuticoccus mangrovi TaxID=2796142 RepID=A0A934II06_9HYPH|nr:glutathione S-transferase family protein [Acuticoccus mangrovi]MBJ3777079.1 glutathione S-transferase family protein [Acuticoccus mangrovi]
MIAQETNEDALRLIGSRRSPYVRKTTLFAHEAGLAGRIALVPVVVNMRMLDPDPVNPHPLKQVPTLIAPSGEAIYDSFVICSWLAEAAGPAGQALFEGPRGRTEVLTRHALAQSTMDHQIRLYSERRRFPDQPESDFARGVGARLGWGCDALEDDAGGWMVGPFDLGQIAAAAMLSYMDFRFADLAWRDGRPKLAAWFDGLAERPSMLATVYQG